MGITAFFINTSKLANQIKFQRNSNQIKTKSFLEKVVILIFQYSQKQKTFQKESSKLLSSY